MRKYPIYVVFTLLILSCSHNEHKTPVEINKTPITIDSTGWNYTLTMITNKTYKRMEFRSYPVDSGRFYSEMSYHTDPPVVDSGCMFCPKGNIVDEFADIKRLWDTARTKIRINLGWVTFDSPEQYKDILRDYISLVQSSPTWKSYLRKRKTPDLNSVWLEKVFQEGNVYEPIDSLLKHYGYSIAGYNTEESYYLTRKFLRTNGYDSTLLIPMPLIFGISVKHIN